MVNRRAACCLCLLAVGAWVAQSADVSAVGMRGGGGGRGGMGGGAHMGGGGGRPMGGGGGRPMGGGGRPGGGISHGSAPNLGGARPQISRPQGGGGRPNLGGANLGGRPGGARPTPNLPNVNRPNYNRPNLGGMQRPAGGLNPGYANRPGGARPNLPGNLPNVGTRPGQRPNTSIPNLANRPQLRPGGGQYPNLPGGINRPGGNRPSGGNLPGGIGQGNRPSTLPGNIGAGGNRPGGNRPGGGTLPGGIGQGNRPSTLPGNIGAGGNRPGGNRPGGYLPGGGRPDGGLANRPGGRPSAGDLNDFLGIQNPNRPGVRPGGDRPVTLPGRPGTVPGGGNRPGGDLRPGGGDRPVTLPGRPGDRPGIGDRPGGGNRPGIGDRPGGGNRPGIGDRPGGGNRPGIGDRPGGGNRPGGGGDRPGGGNRPNRPGWDNRPDWSHRPGGPGGNWRPGGDNGHIHRPPNWANRPGSININNNWNTIINRSGNNMGNWIARNPARGAFWGSWGGGIRNNWWRFHGPNNWFGAGWWNVHFPLMGGWHYHFWNHNQPWSYWWSVPVWNNLNTWFAWSTPTGYWSQPLFYDYGPGGNVVYQDNRVFIDGQQVGTRADFAASAATLATVEPPATEQEAEDAEWMPLGTFAVSTSERDNEPSRTVQLAVNRQGIVSGTLYNSATDTAQTVLGQVDKDTQRVALRIGESDDVVVETGLYNLTQDECPVMVHFGTDKSENWLLVRLDYEGDDSGGDASQ